MKRKVFELREPTRALTVEDCERLAEEAERYREAVVKHLEKLDLITGEDWRLRVK